MKKIDIAELLKDCPKGMELNCTICDDFYFSEISNDIPQFPIRCYYKHNGYTNMVSLTREGRLSSNEAYKCIIFPKGKTTWEGFIPPCKFKDGDIITDLFGTCIFKREGKFEGSVDYYCGINNDNIFNVKDCKNRPYSYYGFIVNYRLSTETEKQKLFDAIKANGYRWNAETKTLEKLVKPIFKVGDIVKSKNCPTAGSFVITGVKENSYSINLKNHCIKFDDQDNYELVLDKFDVNTLKPFDKVLVRDTDKTPWHITFYELYDDKNYPYPYYTLRGTAYKYCIPYKGNEYLRGQIKDCDPYYKSWINKKD